ncbi:MAG: DUF11 domain-containing protein, partial [Caldilineaceae bacterium]|nr:DUF11 domain-containing protein [Caldilineaceae bacterium]
MQPLDHRVPTGHRAQSHLKWVLRLCVVVVALGWSLIEAFGQPAHRALAQPSAQLELTESVSASQVESGAPFQYLLVYGCIDTGTNCTGATITDVLPPQLTYIPDSASKTADVQSVTFTPDPSGATGGTLTWHFKDPLPSGRSGMVRFQAKFPPGTVPGTTALDHATFSASNAASVTTVDVATTATGVFEMFARKQGGPAITGNATDFSVEICSPDDVGGVRLMSPVITDTLPAGAIFIGAEGTQDVDWTYSPVISPNIGGTVTFVNLPPVPVGECLARRVTIRYNLVPGSQQTNAILASGTPEGCTGSPLPAYCQGQSTRTLSANLPFSVINPYAQATTSKTSTSLSSFEGTEARPGETVTYTVSAGNAGYLALANTIVTDTVPIELALASWTAGGAPTRPVTTAYQLNGGSWVVVPNGPFTSDAVITVAQLNLPPGNAITALRWELGTVAVGAAGWNARVAGAVKNTLVPQDPPQTFQNCVTTGSKTLTQTVQSCNTVRVVANRSIPRVTRSGTPGVRYPLEVIDYTVELSNAGVAQLPLDNPVLADLIAPELTIVPGSVLFDTGASAPGAPVPNFEVLANYGGSGKTLLRWSWTNKAGSGGADARFSLQPGRKLVVRYQVMVVDGTVPGVYDTMTALADWSGPTNPNNPTNPQNIFLCNGDAAYVDTLDLDGDGIFTERSCKQSLPAAVGVSLALQGRKYVRGLVDCATYGTAACEDGDFNKLGLTVPGGAVDYRVVITNSSNVSVTNLVMVDILPAIGDTAVVASVNRLSAWRPNLQGPVTGPGGVPLTIWYSTKGNPCRPEMIASGPPGCEAPSWSTTLPGDPTSVRSIKIELCNYDINGQRTECLVLPRGSSVTFDWPMVAPYDAPADASCLTPPQGHLFNRAANPACQIAWNSFGFSAVEATQPPGAPGAVVFQPAEPSKTGVRVGPAGAGAYTVGNLVWLDVAGWENDGIQQSVEQMVGGLSGIRVELYNGAGAYLAYRITGPSNTGQPGYYAFTNLPAGSYKLRFYLPAGFSPAPQNAGSDDALDSDGFSSGTDPTYGDYYETELFNLTADDLTRDFGVWRPVDYGDAPAQYPTVVSEANQGDAARHVIVSGIRLGATVDAETNGQPHAKAHGDDTVGAPDDEDGIGFPSYLGTAALPTAVMFIGESSTLTVTAATIDPVSRPGYLSAWIDFNRNNVWEVTEQVITNLAINGVAQVSVTVPATATAGGTVARFRYSTQPSLPPTGTASDGEVEDYAVQLLAAPQKTIAVTSEAHSLDPEVVIGEIVRYRLVAQIPEGQVTNFKIEDRIPFNLQFFDDGTAKVAFVSTNGITSTDAGLNGAAVAGNAPVTPSFVIPAANISGGPFGSGTKPVFSFGTLTNPDTDADAEYVVVELNALVLNSSFNQDGQTRTNSFVVSFDNVNRESSGVTVTIRKPAVRITKELLTRPAQLAPGVAVTYTIEISHAFWSNADAFEVVISDVVPPELENPQIISVTSSGVTPPVDAGSIVDSMIRVPAAGEFDLPRGAWVRIYFSATIASDVPSPYVIKNVGRVDWTSLPDNGTVGNPTGSTTPGPSGERDGERNGYGSYNDYRSTNSAEFQVDSDWGDLPDGPYPTKKANNGASHLVQLSGNPFLGAQVDIDDIDRINASATGDDNGDRNDDEDGVVFLTPFQPGQPAVVRVTTGTPGYLSVFIDFDDNGTLDTVPITSVTTVSGTGTGYIPNGGLIGDMYFNAAGTYDLTIPVPANAVGPMASRFRFTKTAGEGGNSPLGKAASGEVEDYILNSVGDQLWIDDGGPNLLNAANGRFDAGESPVPAGVALALVRSGTTTPIATATTDASGRYRFNGLSPGDYQIVVTAANFQPGGPLAGTLSTFTAEPNANADGDNNDNGIDVLDPAVSGIASSSFTLDLATEPDVAIDGDGVNSNLTVDFGFVRNDWGDLPDGPYNSDGIGTAGPSHTVVPGLYMGALVDAEVTGQPDAAAQGDDLNGGADDEDGVTLPPYFFAGSTTTVPVNVVNSTAVQAVLYGFIDFNGDGDFLDAGEKVTATVPASTSGPVNLLFNVPTSATTAASFGARFRLSTSNNLTADGPAPNGEVEDYLATAQRFDLALTKVLASGQGSTMRSGDTVTFTLNVINQGTLPAYNIALVDYLPPGFTLADSDWTDLGDGRAVLNAPLAGPLTPAATASVDITLYTGTRTGGIFKNYAEISAADNDTDAGNPLPVDADSTPDANNSESPVVDNEINKNGKFTPGDDEDDHDVAAIEVLVFDWGDLPDGNAVNSPNYQTLQANGGPVHQMIPGLRLGALVDSEFNGQPAAAADGDDTVDSDDEDGVAFPVFYASKQAVVTATVFITPGQPSRVYRFIDFNGDGDFNDTNEAVSSVVSSSGSVPVTFTVPLGADTTKLLGARFRLSTDANLGSGGAASNGEVEDYLIQVLPVYDHGDLPDAGAGTGPQDYQTLLANGGPRHQLVPGVYLGAGVDDESDGQPTVGATGDDANGDDDDGVIFRGPATPGTTVQIEVIASTAGYLNAWFDWNENGDLEASEQPFLDRPLVAGSNLLDLAVPAGISPAEIFCRFRFTTGAGQATTPGGTATNGEVEDYVLMSLGDNLWLDNGEGSGTPDDGIQNGNEVGVAGVTVQLRGANNQVLATTYTDG